MHHPSWLHADLLRRVGWIMKSADCRSGAARAHTVHQCRNEWARGIPRADQHWGLQYLEKREILLEEMI